jgi:isoleucyl-tRNA synthetase
MDGDPADYVTTEDGTAGAHGPRPRRSKTTWRARNTAWRSTRPSKRRLLRRHRPGLAHRQKRAEVDSPVNAHLQEHGCCAEAKIVHSYPHCWRSKMPVVFRATEQWFVSVDKESPDTDKTSAMARWSSIEHIAGFPPGARSASRACSNRARTGASAASGRGACRSPLSSIREGRSLLTKESVLAVAEHIGKKAPTAGSPIRPARISSARLSLPEGFSWTTSEGREHLRRLVRVRMQLAQCRGGRRGWPIPVDLYLEGSDQHRGWFQLSLLPALGSIGEFRPSRRPDARLHRRRQRA